MARLYLAYHWKDYTWPITWQGYILPITERIIRGLSLAGLYLAYHWKYYTWPITGRAISCLSLEGLYLAYHWQAFTNYFNGRPIEGLQLAGLYQSFSGRQLPGLSVADGGRPQPGLSLAEGGLCQTRQWQPRPHGSDMSTPEMIAQPFPLPPTKRCQYGIYVLQYLHESPGVQS